ncbi:MAG TPA: nucleoside triphosphate pyrophosphohydrolase family protein, partial [Cyclobacteriaceae bacterium]|nr:nucleoside triphosphate pyrophosphohydrolase family protein [Cyclobacteriaceae bacterium]
MQQPDSLQLVADFHRTFRHPILSKPGIPDETRCKLRVALIAEELKELEVAILEKDIVEVADALCDIQYVLSGAILEFGLGDKFKALFEEVQRSNMSKACATEEEAKADQRASPFARGGGRRPAAGRRNAPRQRPLLTAQDASTLLGARAVAA